MEQIRTIAVMGPDGIRFLEPFLPMAWNGEKNCFVGPFSSRDVAEYYAQYVVAVKSMQPYQVLAKRDSWYVQVGEVTASPQKALPSKKVRLGK